MEYRLDRKMQLGVSFMKISRSNNQLDCQNNHEKVDLKFITKKETDIYMMVPNRKFHMPILCPRQIRKGFNSAAVPLSSGVNQLSRRKVDAH
jgi:hypothetical protein